MMRMLATLRSAAVIVAVAAATLCAPAWAREITAAERAGLADKVAAFDKATRGNDFTTVIDALPPRLLKAIADSASVEPSVLRKGMIDQSAAAMASVKVLSFSMDLSKAKHLQLSNGEPYALIPTQFIMEAGGRKVQTDGETVALMDGGKWFLVRITSAQQGTILTQIYPEFSGVTFAGEATKVIP